MLGNSTYKNAARLSNPANDAAAVAATLKGAGFDVVDSRLDLQIADMRRALRDFADQARDADIVDACRNNPFADRMKRTVGSRAVTRGLARIEPATSNTLVAFAAKAGLTALDGNSTNSPYATALVKHIATPGLDLRRAFGFIRDDVMRATGNKQEPYVYGSLGGEDVALVPSPVASMPAANAQSEIRRDYELALQLGNKEAMSAFLAQYPEGYYANLAKLQLAKFAAEETRVAATEKARLAEQERARLATEGARSTDQEKAAADAKEAEAIRIAAEEAKQAAQRQAAEAERQRVATATPATDKASDLVAAADSAGANNAAAGPTPTKAQGENLAMVSAAPTQADIAKSVQTELRRLGCLRGAADGEWNAASQRSMELFNRHAGTKFDIKLANTNALDAIKLRPSRVCPLICEHGSKADGDRCSRIVCAEGSFLNDDNECEKRRPPKSPTAKRDDGDRPDRAARDRPRPDASTAKPQASGQIVCNTGGCRPVARGCHLEYKTFSQGGPVEGQGGNTEVCR